LGEEPFLKKLLLRKEYLVAEKELRSRKDLRKDTKRRTVSDRMESILHYELLNYAKPDSRSESVRRSQKGRRINEAKEK